MHVPRNFEQLPGSGSRAFDDQYEQAAAKFRVRDLPAFGADGRGWERRGTPKGVAQDQVRHRSFNARPV